MDAFFLKKEIEQAWNAHVDHAMSHKLANGRSDLELPVLVLLGDKVYNVVATGYTKGKFVIKIDDEPIPTE